MERRDVEERRGAHQICFQICRQLQLLEKLDRYEQGAGQPESVDRKREEEAAFAAWVAQDAKRKEVYGDVLSLLEKGYTSSSEYKKISTYLGEAFLSGAEIVKLARMIQSVDVKGSTPEEIDIFLEDNIKSFFKDYDASLDRRCWRLDEDRKGTGSGRESSGYLQEGGQKV